MLKKRKKVKKIYEIKQQLHSIEPSNHRSMVVDIMVPTHSVIRSHKKKIERSPSMIFPQGMVTTKVLPSEYTISNLQQ
jgi:hypothetical protein